MDSIPDYAAVTTSVQLAKKIHKKLGGLTNAILRTIIKKDNKLIINKKSSIERISDYTSHPEWLLNKWIRDLNYEETISLTEWNNANPSIWFRVNTLDYSIAKFENYLSKNNIEYRQFDSIPLFFTTSKNQELISSDIFKEGKITVQDPAAGLVVKLLNPNKDDKIIDVCSAPGGKTSFMAQLMKNTGEILALDSDKKRLDRLNNTLSRLNITNTLIEHNDILDDNLIMTDKMLLDVPCSGTGVMAKRADLRWRRTIDEILEMHLLQRKILWTASKYINKNGILVYSTCSIEPEENDMVIDAFLKSHSNFTIEPADNYIDNKFVNNDGRMYTFPHKDGVDGGYAVRLKNNV